MSQPNLTTLTITLAVLAALEHASIPAQATDRDTLDTLALNLGRAGSVTRWFRSGPAGEQPRPDVVARLLHGLTLPVELVPQFVRILAPEGPVRKQALERALRQEITHPSSSDPFHDPEAPEPPLPSGRVERIADLIQAPQRSTQERVEEALRLEGIDFRLNISSETRHKLAAVAGCTEQGVRNAVYQLRKQHGCCQYRHVREGAAALSTPSPRDLAAQAAAQLLSTGDPGDARIAAQLLQQLLQSSSE